MDPTSQRPWQPLVRGPQAARAHRILDEIATTLAEPPAQLPFHLDGLSGRALFFAYLSQARGGDDVARRLSDRYLDLAVDALADADTDAALWSGFVGVAWVSQHLRGRFAGDDADDLNGELDELLVELVTHSPWRRQTDLINGLAGHAVYAMERIGRPVGRALLSQVVARIGELARKDDAGVSWRTPPEQLVPWRRAECPTGLFDLGAAHGIPALVSALAGACAAGVAPDVARPLLDGAVRWMVSQRRGEPSGFPAWIHDGGVKPARLAWCYGDPGVAAALLAAARAVDQPRWAEAALEIGRRAARRGHDDNEAAELGVFDSGLCHGALGLSLIFQRLWHDGNEALFADAASRWYTRALDQHRPGVGLAGYRAFDYPPDADPGDGAPAWVDDASLLTGITGIGLGLLAGVSTVEPAWDRLLAVSLPPSG